MSNHKTFIGAYARNRRGGQASDAPSNRGAGVNDVPPLPSQPHTTPAVPPHHFSAIAETTPEPLPCPTDSSAELPTDALSHSVVVSSTYPDADGLWLGDDQDRILRIDAAATADSQPQADVSPGVQAVSPGVQAVTGQAASVSSVPGSAEQTATEPPHVSRQAVEQRAGWGGADWEVDAFQLPQSVVDLFFDETLFRSIAEHMGRSVESGLRSVLITSVGPREGRTTVTIGTAIAAAAAGIRVAIVDVDLESPQTAERLRLDVQSDWVAAIREGVELESIAVRSLEDGVTLIPLLDNEEDSMLASSRELDSLLDRIVGCFDLVLFDASPLDSWSVARIASFIDAALLVRDVRTTSETDASLAADRLRGLGVNGIGVVANFCG